MTRSSPVADSSISELVGQNLPVALVRAYDSFTLAAVIPGEADDKHVSPPPGKVVCGKVVLEFHASLDPLLLQHRLLVCLVAGLLYILIKGPDRHIMS